MTNLIHKIIKTLLCEQMIKNIAELNSKKVAAKTSIEENLQQKSVNHAPHYSTVTL